MKIYTNNPQVKDTDSVAVYYKKSLLELLTIIRDQIHLGAKLLSDPTPASRRMLESPFRSVILIEAGEVESLDLHSLETIEKALLHYNRIQKIKSPIAQTVVEDFQYVDEQLLQSTLKELRIS